MVSGVCRICRFVVPLDDTLGTHISPSGWTVCLRCFCRETGSGLRITIWLREELELALKGVSL